MRKNRYTEFKELHYQTDVLYLFNCWDVMSAKIIENKGAKALATSSYAVSDANGYTDGEYLPFENLLQLSEKLVQNSNVPVSIDAEGFYAQSSELLHQNAQKLFGTGITGINFEDQKPQSKEYALWSVDEQSERIKILKSAAEDVGSEIFINARIDVFFLNKNHSVELVNEALNRAESYALAGADCIFIPGLTEISLIKEFTKHSPLPVNIMLNSFNRSSIDWRSLGVNRVSYGPHSYFQMKETLLSNLVFKV